jgi:hypothetical protein
LAARTVGSGAELEVVAGVATGKSEGAILSEISLRPRPSDLLDESATCSWTSSSDTPDVEAAEEVEEEEPAGESLEESM